MELNIQNIADQKIKDMHESGQIATAIQNGVEKLILKAVDDALNGYELKRTIEKNISESVSGVVTDIGFNGYNGLIAQKVKEITQDVMRADIAQKIQKTFDDLLIKNFKGIKLSEIFEKYRNWVCENTEESEKWEKRNFHCSLDVKEDGSFTHYKVKFNDEPLDKYDRHAAIEFTMCTYGNKSETAISTCYINGEYAKGKLNLGTLTDIEAMLANLYYNQTPIILDVDDVDDSDHFDIDC